MTKSLPLVRLQLLAPLLSGLRDIGVDPNPVLESVGLTASAVEQDDAAVHVMVMHHFLENCAKAAGDPTFCAKIGARLDPTGWPMVRQAFEQATTLGDFLNIYVSNAAKYASSATAFVEVRGETASFGEERKFKPLITPAQNDGFMIGLQMAVLLRALGHIAQPERVLLVLCDPTVLHADFNRFQALRGNTMGPRVQFPSEWLLHTIESDPDDGKPEVGDQGMQQDRFLSGFRQLLRQNICNEGFDAAKAAALVHMGPRSLTRRLSPWNTNTAKELTRARIEYAKSALGKSDMSIGEIALRLGYTNPSNLARAFAKEEGMSPKDFRASNAKQR